MEKDNKSKLSKLANILEDSVWKFCIKDVIQDV
jgi:hypothetical protein